MKKIISTLALIIASISFSLPVIAANGVKGYLTEREALSEYCGIKQNNSLSFSCNELKEQNIKPPKSCNDRLKPAYGICKRLSINSIRVNPRVIVYCNKVEGKFICSSNP